MNLQRLFQNEPNIQSYSAGEMIFDEGDSAEVMYVLLEGSVEVVLGNGDRVIERLEPGGVLGELALVDHSPRSAGAIAKTDSRLASVDRRRFTFLVQQHPLFALHIMSIMAERLRRQTG